MDGFGLVKPLAQRLRSLGPHTAYRAGVIYPRVRVDAGPIDGHEVGLLEFELQVSLTTAHDEPYRAAATLYVFELDAYGFDDPETPVMPPARFVGRDEHGTVLRQVRIREPENERTTGLYGIDVLERVVEQLDTEHRERLNGSH